MPPEPGTLGIVLLSGEYERAHHAFMLAVAAAAMGRRVVLFATNGGCHAVTEDWSALRGGSRPAMDQDGDVRAKGVAGLDELRDAATELGVVLTACDSGLRIAGVSAADLLPWVGVSGLAGFLSATAGAQVVTI